MSKREKRMIIKNRMKKGREKKEEKVSEGEREREIMNKKR